MDRFLIVHELTAEFEGGWSDHPADPGGRTMYGITEAVYHAWLKRRGLPERSVRLITREEALKIYREEYWLKAGCDKLALGVDRMVYDAAVNSGVKRSRGWLMEAIGGSDAETIERLYSIRMTFLRKLRTWKTFGKGWTRRVEAMRARALKEVRTAQPKPIPKPVRDVIEDADKGAESKTLWSMIAAAIAAIFTGFGDLSETVQLALIGGVVLAALFVIWERIRKRGLAKDAKAAMGEVK